MFSIKRKLLTASTLQVNNWKFIPKQEQRWAKVPFIPHRCYRYCEYCSNCLHFLSAFEFCILLLLQFFDCFGRSFRVVANRWIWSMMKFVSYFAIVSIWLIWNLHWMKSKKVCFANKIDSDEIVCYCAITTLYTVAIL